MADVCWCPYCEKANFIDCDKLDDTKQYSENCCRCGEFFTFRFLWKADITTSKSSDAILGKGDAE